MLYPHVMEGMKWNALPLVLFKNKKATSSTGKLIFTACVHLHKKIFLSFTILAVN